MHSLHFFIFYLIKANIKETRISSRPVQPFAAFVSLPFSYFSHSSLPRVSFRSIQLTTRFHSFHSFHCRSFPFTSLNHSLIKVERKVRLIVPEGCNVQQLGSVPRSVMGDFVLKLNKTRIPFSNPVKTNGMNEVCC